MTEYWYIWYEAFENGVLIGRGKYHRSYRSRSGARGRAKQMWDKPLHNPLTNTTIVYRWKISHECPWNDINYDA